MNIVNLVSQNNILDFIYSFLLIFCFCIFGSFLKDCHDAIKKIGKINIFRIIVSSSFSTFCLSFVFSYIRVTFPAFVFICFVVGIWSSFIMDATFNLKIVFLIAKNIFKQMSDPVSKGVGEAMQELQDDEEKKRNKKSKKNNDSDDSEEDNNSDEGEEENNNEGEAE